MNRLARLVCVAALGLAVPYAAASPTPEGSKAPKPVPPPKPSSSSREPVTVARSAPAVVELLKQAKAIGYGDGPEASKNSNVDETVTQISLGGQCGFAGCSSSTLVAFTYRTRGANTTTKTVLALVTCEPAGKSPCNAVPAEVRPTSAGNPAQ